MGGLEFSLDFESDLYEIENILNQFKTRDVVQAARRALNRAAVSVRQKSMDEFRKKLNVKEKDLRKRMRVHTAQGNSLAKMESAVSYSGAAFPMISFVKGAKTPIAQKGIPVKKRRKLKVEIEKGKTFTAKGAFIQRVKSKSKGGESYAAQVFRGRRGKGFKKQGIRSLGFIITNRGLADLMLDHGGKRFQKEFYRELKVRADGIVASARYGNKK